jgi:glucokinase
MKPIINKPVPAAIGLDVGATKIAAGLINSKGQVCSSKLINTQPDLGVQSVIARMVSLIEELSSHSTNEHDHSCGSILGIGIGIPGQIASEDGIVYDAVNLGWNEVHLKREIKKRFKFEFPIWIETDTNASTMGEYYFGTARGIRDFVYISIGSGLGGGLFIDGELHIGMNGKAAELGHLSLDPNGRECVCGLRGCAETIVSGSGLTNIVNGYLAENKYPTKFHSMSDITVPAIVSAAKNGDVLAMAAVSKMGRCLGIVIANCLSIIDPDLIVIGGGLGSASFDMILTPIKQEIGRRILPSIHRNIKIKRTDQPSSAHGAASLVFSQTPEIIIQAT